MIDESDIVPGVMFEFIHPMHNIIFMIVEIVDDRHVSTLWNNKDHIEIFQTSVIAESDQIKRFL